TFLDIKTEEFPFGRESIAKHPDPLKSSTARPTQTNLYCSDYASKILSGRIPYAVKLCASTMRQGVPGVPCRRATQSTAFVMRTRLVLLRPFLGMCVSRSDWIGGPRFESPHRQGLCQKRRTFPRFIPAFLGLTLKSTGSLATAESQFEWPRRAEIVRA